MMFALVETDGDKRSIFGFYDALPDDARLTQAMQFVIEGRTPPILGFDVKTGETDEGRMIEPLTLEVVASKGAMVSVDKVEADGVAFDGAAAGAAEARLSDLICPVTVDVLRRSAFFTSGEVDGSQESGCRYVGERARVAIVATRSAPGASLKDAMTQMIASPMAYSKGQPASTPALSGDLPVGTMSAFFDMPDGAHEGVWAFKRGDWFVEIYALCGAGDEAAVGAAVDSLLAANKAP
jgi:hypothetical protein